MLPISLARTNDAIDDFIASNPTMQTIHATGAKPSFLLWDKVWRKLSSTEDEAWLTYALESVVTVDEDRFAKDVNLRLVSPCLLGPC